jgi:diguanylate cyclase (GGDEF)-like protein
VASVLIIDDSAAVRAEVRGVLEGSGRYERILEARDGLEGLRLLLAEPLDAVICDLEMPGLDGEKLLVAQRARDGGEALPFLFLTAQRDPERLARLLRAGASDWIQKPFHPAELLARLDLQVRMRRLQAELREKNVTLARLSTTDPVTLLRTRRYVADFLAFEVMRAQRYHSPLSVVMADLDHFKRVNDDHGHRAGDQVLRATADTLRATLRATDVAARYGGEEFLLVLPQTDLAGAERLAQRACEAVAALAVDVGGPDLVQVTMSAGVASLDAAVDDAEQLVEAADVALYRAKEAGRNRVCAHGSRGALDRPQGNRKPARGGRRT